MAKDFSQLQCSRIFNSRAHTQEKNYFFFAKSYMLQRNGRSKAKPTIKQRLQQPTNKAIPSGSPHQFFFGKQRARKW
jgi:hypothetical protein